MTFTSGPQELAVDGDAGGKPAPADRHENGLDRVRVLAQDFHADRALSGDHVGIVVGMDEDQSLLRLELPRVRVGFIEAVAVQNDRCAVAANSIDLYVGRGARHDDGRLRSQKAGG